MNYRYRAVDPQGRRIRGSLRALSLDQAVGELASKGYTPLEVTPGPNLGFASRPGIYAFTSQLASLLQAGLGLGEALRITLRSTDTLAPVVEELLRSVEEGRSLSQALSAHPRHFPPYYTSTIQAAESAGILELALERLALSVKEAEENRRFLMASLAYPLAFVCVGTLSVVGILVFAIPRFEMIFQTLDQVLPLPTRILLALSRWLTLTPWLALIPGALLIGGILWGRQIWEAWRLRAPIIGPILRQAALIRFTRTLAAMLQGGVPLLGALDLAAKASGDPKLAREVQELMEVVSQGGSLAGGMETSTSFPPLLTGMLRVGEETGKIWPLLDAASGVLEEAQKARIRSRLALIEPIVVLGMAVVVGFIVLAMLTPVVQISRLI